MLSGDIYSGPLVDVWSAGVILYTLLVGKLPFEDDNLGQLYKKIQSGVFHIPMWLSKDARSVITSMLQVNPRNRVTVQQLLKHPWMNAYKPPELIEIRKGQIDEEVRWQTISVSIVLLTLFWLWFIFFFLFSFCSAPLASAQILSDDTIWRVAAKYIGKVWLSNRYLLAAQRKAKKSRSKYIEQNWKSILI